VPKGLSLWGYASVISERKCVDLILCGFFQANRDNGSS
jgi:hypothetical protein